MKQYCTNKNHGDQIIKLVCVDQLCNKNRRLCYQCVVESIHNHEQNIIQISVFEDTIIKKRQEYTRIQQDLYEGKKFLISQIQIIQTMVEEQQQQLDLQLTQSIHKLNIILTDIMNHRFTEESINQSLQLLNNKSLNMNQTQGLLINLNQDLTKIGDKYNRQFDELKKQPVKHIRLLNNNNSQVSVNLNHTKNIMRHENADWIQAISVSPCDKYLISSGCDKQIIIWDLQSTEIIEKIQYTSIISALCFSNCSKIIYFGDQQGIIHNIKWNCNRNNQMLQRMNVSHTSKIEFLIVMSVKLLSISEDSIKISIINPSQLINTIKLPIQIDAIEYSESENFIVVADIKNIIIWDARENNDQLIKQQIKTSNHYYVRIQLLNQDTQLALSMAKLIIIYWINFQGRNLTESTRIKSNEEIINLIGQNLNRLTYITSNEIIQVGFSEEGGSQIHRRIKQDTVKQIVQKYIKHSKYKVQQTSELHNHCK